MLIQFERQIINGSETYPKKFKWEPSKYAWRMQINEEKTPSLTLSCYLCDVLKERHPLQVFFLIYVMYRVSDKHMFEPF
jgi:hypothetical protein